MKLSINSKDVQEGDIFFCIKGSKFNGHDFIPDAVKNGAKIIIHDEDIKYPDIKDVTFIKVDNSIDALSHASASINGYPSDKLKMFGVTGTNGKSSISYIISKLYSKHFAPCGYIGTISATLGDKSWPTHLTTPDIIPLHKLLRNMYESGGKACAMEASAHGLIQKRLRDVCFDYAIYTNLTKEHMDYFADMEDYFAAKSILFQNLSHDSFAIINNDDPYSQKLKALTKGKIITYGIERDSDYMAKDISFSKRGSSFTLVHGGKEYNIITNMEVIYNIYNLLAIASVLHNEGLSMYTIAEEFRSVSGVPGRMLHIDLGQPFEVLVDYAHTIDSFKKLLPYVRERIGDNHKIIIAYGSPSERDSSNRTLFGKYFNDAADKVILTQEDSRNEDIVEISKEVALGFDENFDYEIIPDRESAIEKAVSSANAGDAVLILGKGTEQYLESNGTSNFWMGDDEAAKKALKKLP